MNLKLHVEDGFGEKPLIFNAAKSIRITGTRLPDEWWAEVVTEIVNGRKVNAIKAHRAATGLGLKESKAEVDELAAVLHDIKLRHAVAFDKTIKLEDLV